MKDHGNRSFSAQETCYSGPMEKDVSREEYQLLLTTEDSFEAEVLERTLKEAGITPCISPHWLGEKKEGAANAIPFYVKKGDYEKARALADTLHPDGQKDIAPDVEEARLKERGVNILSAIMFTVSGVFFVMAVMGPKVTDLQGKMDLLYWVVAILSLVMGIMARRSGPRGAR